MEYLRLGPWVDAASTWGCPSSHCKAIMLILDSRSLFPLLILPLQCLQAQYSCCPPCDERCGQGCHTKQNQPRCVPEAGPPASREATRCLCRCSCSLLLLLLCSCPGNGPAMQHRGTLPSETVSTSPFVPIAVQFGQAQCCCLATNLCGLFKLLWDM